MKTLHPDLLTTLASESMTLTWCWLITRTDNVKLGFTSFDLPLTIEGITYTPETGFDPSAVDYTEGTSRSTSQSLQGFFTLDKISESDIVAGLYDYSTVTAFVVDPTKLPASLTDNPPKHITMFQGTIANISRTERNFTLEARGIDYQLEADFGELTSKFCRNNFGDSKCGVDLSPHTYNHQVTAVSNNYTFTIDTSYPDDNFTRGLMILNGIKRDIATSSGNQIVLFQPFPSTISVGQTVTLIRGCAKTLLACAIFGGILGNQSEPHVPLPDDALNTPISEG